MTDRRVRGFTERLAGLAGENFAISRDPHISLIRIEPPPATAVAAPPSRLFDTRNWSGRSGRSAIEMVGADRRPWPANRYIVV